MGLTLGLIIGGLLVVFILVPMARDILSTFRKKRK